MAALTTVDDGSAKPVRVEALVAGAGPAGLAVGACLRRANVPYLIVEEGEHVGISWHAHYHRLHLHTVKRYSALPFMPFPNGCRTTLPGLYFSGFHNVATGLLREIGREAKRIAGDISEQRG